MKTKFYLLFLCILSSSILCSQTNLLNGPEGIGYDKITKSYFVTNATDGKIIRIDSLGNHSMLYQGLSVPMGIHIIGDSLLVSSNDPSTISCIQIGTGILLEELVITESASLAHMDYDSRTHSLYVIGQQGQAFKIDVSTMTYEEFVPIGGGLANSSQTCVVDTNENSMYVFSWPTTFVRKVDLENPDNVVNLVNPECGQYIDCIRGPQEFIYVASWQGNKIHKFEPDCSILPEVFESGFNKPAGLVYNPDEDVIAVCNYGNNTVDFIPMNTTDVKINTGMNKSEPDLYPNPAKNTIFFRHLIPEGTKVRVRIQNSLGQVIHRQTEFHCYSGSLELEIDCSEYQPGIFFMTLILNEKDKFSQKFIKY